MYHYSKLSQVLVLNTDWRLVHPKFALNKWTQNARCSFDILRVQQEDGVLFFIICFRTKSSVFGRGKSHFPEKKKHSGTVNLCCIVTQLFACFRALSGMMTFMFAIAERKLSITFIANVYYFLLRYLKLDDSTFIAFHAHAFRRLQFLVRFRLKVVKCVQYN